MTSNNCGARRLVPDRAEFPNFIATGEKEAVRLIIPLENPLTMGHLSRTAWSVATSIFKQLACQVSWQKSLFRMLMCHWTLKVSRYASRADAQVRCMESSEWHCVVTVNPENTEMMKDASTTG